LQGVPVRHGLARRPLSRRVAGRARDLVVAGSAGASEIRAAQSAGPRMSRLRLRCVSIAVALYAVTTSAQQPAPPPSFRFERPIVTGGAGPRRLAIDVPVLVGTAPVRPLRGSPRCDLVRDLRIY